MYIFGDLNLPDVDWPISGSRSYSPSSQFLVDLLFNLELGIFSSNDGFTRLLHTSSERLDLFMRSVLQRISTQNSF